MADRPAPLSADEIAIALRNRPDWSGDTSGIERTIECASFPAAIDLVRKVADLAEELDHHPDIDIRWRTVRFAVVTHSAGGVTEADLGLAERIDALTAQ